MGSPLFYFGCSKTPTTNKLKFASKRVGSQLQNNRVSISLHTIPKSGQSYFNVKDYKLCFLLFSIIEKKYEGAL
jgi:hypothetical protein